MEIFRIGFGPNGALYGSSILPAHLIQVDFATHKVNDLGLLGGGELYSLFAHGSRIAMGAYAGLSPLMSFDPEQPFHPAPNGNPSFANFSGSDEHWRPQAMLEGPDGLIYVGGTAGYGQLEGPLVAWDGKSAQATAYGNLIHNQSVVSLAVWQHQIVGGTTTGGWWEYSDREGCVRVFLGRSSAQIALEIVPVPGASLVTDLIASRSGLVYGIAVENNTSTLFAIDPKRHAVVSRQVLPFRSVPYNGVAADSHGAIWGLGDSGIFRIEDRSHQAALVAKSPVPITAGLAMRGRKLYFFSGSEVYCYDGVTNVRISPQVPAAVTLILAACGAACAQQNILWVLPNFSDRLQVQISNPGSGAVHTLAVIGVASARAIAPGFPGTLAIVADQSGRTRHLPSQVDAGDEKQQEGAFVIPVNLAPRSQQTLEIYYSNTLKEQLPWPKRVDATHSYGYNRATAAIESELIGYRTYGGFYLDVQAHGKGQSGLFNSLIGYTGISSPAAEGEDVLHIGDTLGLGGIFLRDGGSVYRPPLNTPDYALHPAKRRARLSCACRGPVARSRGGRLAALENSWRRSGAARSVRDA